MVQWFLLLELWVKAAMTIVIAIGGYFSPHPFSILWEPTFSITREITFIKLGSDYALGKCARVFLNDVDGPTNNSFVHSSVLFNLHGRPVSLFHVMSDLWCDFDSV